MDLIESLKKSELFSGLSGKHREKLNHLGREISIKRNRSLFFEGDEGESFYILLKGSIKLYRTTPDGREVIVKILKEGEIFGEVILFINQSYPVSAISLEDSTIYSIPKKSFHLLMDDKEFRNEFISIIMKKQRYLSNRIHYLSAYDVEERFFRFFLENYGRQETYRINLSKKDLASAIGTIPETLSRLINRLKKRNIIQWDKKDITLQKDFWDDFDI